MAAGDASTGLRLCMAMAPFWLGRAHWTEGIERLRAVLDLPGDDDRLRARALATAGKLLLLRGDLAEADATSPRRGHWRRPRGRRHARPGALRCRS